MMFFDPANASLYFVNSILASVFLGVAWQRRTSSGAFSFMGLMLGVAIWMLAGFLGAMSGAMPLKLFWLRFGMVGLAPLGILLLAFVLAFTGRGQAVRPFL